MTSANNLHRKAAAPNPRCSPGGRSRGDQILPATSSSTTCAIWHPEEANKSACFLSQWKLSAILVRHVDSDRFKNIFFSGRAALTVGPPSLGNFPTCSFRDHQRTLLPALQFSTECTNQVLIGLFIDPHRLIGDGNS